jgi:cell fate (sporulation/competence/biofilm development) regulator YlbF (YheA/YmcA/DUF963 family)
MELNELEIAPANVVQQAARDFAAALAETPQFRAFEEATELLNQDEVAQRAMSAYQEKQHALQAVLMLNAASPEEQAELERLRNSFLESPSVSDYMLAETNLRAVCQASASLLSQHIGLSFAAACSSGCC